jgi:hypothetical protein
MTIVTIIAAAVLAFPAQDAEASQPGTEISAYLVTVAPGVASWERFGHNLLLIQDRARGTSRAYNYGLFSFRQENFLKRFIQGRMLYWMEGFDTEPHLRSYTEAGRTIWIQELNLTPAQQVRLRDFLEWNDAPENRYYRYHYYNDNCSTRLRDALDLALDGQLEQQLKAVGVDATFRSHTQRSVTNDVALYTGLLIGLAQPVDRPITAWEETFLPQALQEHLRNVSVTGPDGQARPLVLSESVIFEGTAPPADDAPPTWLLGYLLVGLVIAAALLTLGRLAPARPYARIGFAALGTIWSLIVGVAGIVLAFLWVFTDHDTSYRNENLFPFNPIAFALAIVFPTVAFGSRVRPVVFWLSVAVAAFTALGFLLQALPSFYQVNGQLYALALPANLALPAALRLASLTAGPGRGN